ncbi:MAG: hypothetical protein ACUVTE_02740 [Candidatus Bathycorpusculaceae bacterium]
MFAYGIFKVIYAPRETLREVSQNPKYIGPVLIMVLFVAVNMGSAYVIATKTYVEETLPSLAQREEWTENKTFWKPLYGAQCTENFTDYVAGRYVIGYYYGNRSIEFSVENSDKISMQLQDIGQVNCSSQGGFTKLYLRVKWTSPEYPPKNVSLYLYSSSNAYFYRDITGEFSNATVNFWNNLTIPFADNYWHGTADWSEITGLMLEFTWNQTSNIKVLIDGLFFGGVFKPYTESVTSYMAFYALYSFMQFIIRWVLLGGVIYILTKAFKAKTVWRVMLILAGFALITMFIQAAISTAALSTMPTVKYPFGYIGGVNGEAESAYQKIAEETWLVNQVYSGAQIATLVWAVSLCAIAVRLTTEFSWTTSLLIAFTAYFAAMFIERFLIQV